MPLGVKERLLAEEVKELRSNSFYDNGSRSASRAGSRTSHCTAKSARLQPLFAPPSGVVGTPKTARGRLHSFVKRLRISFLRTFWATILTFNAHTLLLCGLSCLGVYAAQKYGIAFDVPFGIVTFGTLFPSVFTIGLAFTRREQAAAAVSTLRADFHMLYTSYWAMDVSDRRFGDQQQAKAVGDGILAFSTALQTFLRSHSRYENLAEWMHFSDVVDGRHSMALGHLAQLAHRNKVTAEQVNLLRGQEWMLSDCQRKLMKLQLICHNLNSLSKTGGYIRAGPVILSIRTAFETLRAHRDYRTPVMMRHAQSVLLHVLAIALAPYFNSFCISWKNYGNDEDHCPAGFYAAVIYNVIVMLMFKIQSALEYALDMHGFDDLFFDLVADVKNLLNDAYEVAEIERNDKATLMDAYAEADRDLILSVAGTPCYSDDGTGAEEHNTLPRIQKFFLRSMSGNDDGAPSPIQGDDGGGSFVINIQNSS